MELLKQGTKRQVKDLKKNLNMDENEFAVIPVNDVVDLKKWSAGDHYSTLIYDIKNNNFFHFDSIAGKNNAHAKELAVNLLGGNSFNREGKLNATFIEYKECGRQNNGYDCGLYVIHNMKVAVENLCVPDSYEGHVPMDGEIKILRDTIREQIDKEIRRNEYKGGLRVVSVNLIDELIANKKATNTIGDCNEKNNRESKGINSGSDTKQKAEASYVSQRRRNEDDRNVPKNNNINNRNESNEQAKNNIRENHKESNINSNTSNADNRNNKSKDNAENEARDCRYFWRGTCRYGKRCWFRHMELCRDWETRGSCPDSRCKLNHPEKCNKFYAGRCNMVRCNYLHPSELKIVVENRQQGIDKQAIGQNQGHKSGLNQGIGQIGQSGQQNFGYPQIGGSNQMSTKQEEWPSPIEAHQRIGYAAMTQPIGVNPLIGMNPLLGNLISNMRENWKTLEGLLPGCFAGMQGAW